MNPVSSSPAYSRKGKTFVLPLPMPFTVNILLVAVNNIGTLWSVRYHCDRYTKFFFNKLNIFSAIFRKLIILFDAGDIAYGVAVLHLAGSLTGNAADTAAAMKVPQVRAVVKIGVVRHGSKTAALDDRGFGVVDVHLVPAVLKGGAIRAPRDASKRTRTLNGP